MRILLQFVAHQSSLQRARLEYAFRLFCAIYGHEPVIDDMREQSADVMLTYEPDAGTRNCIRITNVDLIRALHQPAPKPIPYSQGDEMTVLFHAPVAGCEPDWLAEIFEWVSCADEYSCAEHDSVGRVPFSASYIGHHALNPRKPYAAVAMAFLQRAIVRIKPQAPLRPDSPCLAQHIVVNTHDVDFLPTQATVSGYRLAKNALISLSLHRTVQAAVQQAKRAFGLAVGGQDPLNQIGSVAERERERQTTASYYLLGRRGHRRDGNYSLLEATTTMRRLRDCGMEVGVHGSYRSIEKPDGLAIEFEQFRELGFSPVGSRQHWLRFRIPQLVRSVQTAGAAYDTSIGWPDHAGFRAGACFAFPPYDFDHEAPAKFLEIPLVLMDRAALALCKHNGNCRDDVAETLEASRRYGWGGISILWHPTAFGGGQYPAEVGDLFWRLLDSARERDEVWMSGASFLRNVWQRYQSVGLLATRG